MEVVEIASINFEEYGILYNMNEHVSGKGIVNFSSGDGWKDANTAIPVIDTQASLGYTIGSSVPCTVSEMERHQHTQEALFCAGMPIIFLIASESGSPFTKAADVKAVILRPGQVVVLHRGVWHSSAHGLCDTTQYYYLALCYKNEPTGWAEIEGGPITIESPQK